MESERISELTEVDPATATLSTIIESFDWYCDELVTTVVDDIEMRSYSFSYGENWYDSTVGELETLAEQGVVGSIALTGEDDTQWKIRSQLVCCGPTV